MNENQNITSNEEENSKNPVVIVLIVAVAILLIVIGILTLFLVRDASERSITSSESSTMPTSIMTEDFSETTVTSTEVSTSTEPETTTTTMETNLNIESYIGYWHIENVGEEELVIESVSSDKVVFTYWVYRTMSYDYVTAKIEGNIAKFNTDEFYGTLEFADNSIIMTATSNCEYLDLNRTKLIFSMKIKESVVYGNGMKYFENQTDDVIVNGLDSTNFGEIKCSGTIEGMDSSYIIDGGAYKTVRTNLQNGWHISTNIEAYSYGSWWYECYDADDGDYYGWINARYILFYEYEEPAEATIPDIPDLSQSQLNQIAKNLGVPDSISFTASQGAIWYWDGAGIWLRYVNISCENGAVASAAVDAYTGEIQRDICEYSAPFDEDTPNVWCPDCGYGFFVTGVGTDGLYCPQCGANFSP